MDKIDNIGLTRMLTQSYDFDGFTSQEVWSRIAQRMNIIIEHFNYLESTVKDKQELIDKKLDYLINEDLTIISMISDRPETPTSNGNKGECFVNSTHLYICYDTNKWIRIAKDGSW